MTPQQQLAQAQAAIQQRSSYESQWPTLAPTLHEDTAGKLTSGVNNLALGLSATAFGVGTFALGIDPLYAPFAGFMADHSGGAAIKGGEAFRKAMAADPGNLTAAKAAQKEAYDEALEAYGKRKLGKRIAGGRAYNAQTRRMGEAGKALASELDEGAEFLKTFTQALDSQDNKRMKTLLQTQRKMLLSGEAKLATSAIGSVDDVALSLKTAAKVGQWGRRAAGAAGLVGSMGLSFAVQESLLYGGRNVIEGQRDYVATRELMRAIAPQDPLGSRSYLGKQSPVFDDPESIRNMQQNIRFTGVRYGSTPGQMRNVLEDLSKMKEIDTSSVETISRSLRKSMSELKKIGATINGDIGEAVKVYKKLKDMGLKTTAQRAAMLTDSHALSGLTGLSTSQILQFQENSGTTAQRMGLSAQAGYAEGSRSLSNAVTRISAGTVDNNYIRALGVNGRSVQEQSMALAQRMSQLNMGMAQSQGASMMMTHMFDENGILDLDGAERGLNRRKMRGKRRWGRKVDPYSLEGNRRQFHQIQEGIVKNRIAYIHARNPDDVAARNREQFRFLASMGIQDPTEQLEYLSTINSRGRSNMAAAAQRMRNASTMSQESTSLIEHRFLGNARDAVSESFEGVFGHGGDAIQAWSARQRVGLERGTRRLSDTYRGVERTYGSGTVDQDSYREEMQRIRGGDLTAVRPVSLREMANRINGSEFLARGLGGRSEIGGGISASNARKRERTRRNARNVGDFTLGFAGAAVGSAGLLGGAALAGVSLLSAPAILGLGVVGGAALLARKAFVSESARDSRRGGHSEVYGVTADDRARGTIFAGWGGGRTDRNTAFEFDPESSREGGAQYITAESMMRNIARDHGAVFDTESMSLMNPNEHAVSQLHGRMDWESLHHTAISQTRRGFLGSTNVDSTTRRWRDRDQRELTQNRMDRVLNPASQEAYNGRDFNELSTQERADLIGAIQEEGGEIGASVDDFFQGEQLTQSQFAAIVSDTTTRGAYQDAMSGRFTSARAESPPQSSGSYHPVTGDMATDPRVLATFDTPVVTSHGRRAYNRNSLSGSEISDNIDREVGGDTLNLRAMRQNLEVQRGITSSRSLESIGEGVSDLTGRDLIDRLNKLGGAYRRDLDKIERGNSWESTTVNDLVDQLNSFGLSDEQVSEVQAASNGFSQEQIRASIDNENEIRRHNRDLPEDDPDRIMTTDENVDLAEEQMDRHRRVSTYAAVSATRDANLSAYRNATSQETSASIAILDARLAGTGGAGGSSVNMGQILGLSGESVEEVMADVRDGRRSMSDVLEHAGGKANTLGKITEAMDYFQNLADGADGDDEREGHESSMRELRRLQRNLGLEEGGGVDGGDQLDSIQTLSRIYTNELMDDDSGMISGSALVRLESADMDVRDFRTIAAQQRRVEGGDRVNVDTMTETLTNLAGGEENLQNVMMTMGGGNYHTTDDEGETTYNMEDLIDDIVTGDEDSRSIMEEFMKTSSRSVDMQSADHASEARKERLQTHMINFFEKTNFQQNKGAMKVYVTNDSTIAADTEHRSEE